MQSNYVSDDDIGDGDGDGDGEGDGDGGGIAPRVRAHSDRKE